MLQWVRIRSGRKSLTGSDRQPELGAAGRGRSSPRRRSPSASSRIASAITSPSSEVAGGLVAGHHPVDRPAEVDRRRAGRAEGGGRAAEDRPPRVRQRLPRPLRASAPARSPRPGRSPARRGRPSGGSRWRPRAPSGPRPRPARRAARRWSMTEERRRRPRGTACGSRSAARRAGRRRAAPPSDAADAPGRGSRRRPRRCALEGLGGARDRRRGLDQLAGELAEEAPPARGRPPPARDLAGAACSAGSGRRRSALGRRRRRRSGRARVGHGCSCVRRSSMPRSVAISTG